MKSILVLLSIISFYNCSLRAMMGKHLVDGEEKIGIYSLETLANNIRICSCNKIFNTLLCLKNHIRNKHTCKFSIEGEQQSFFRCCKCTQLYTDINELLTHIPEHTYEVLYTCLECEKDFFILSDAREHVAEHKNVLLSNSPSPLINNSGESNLEQEERELETEFYNAQHKKDNSRTFAYLKELELHYKQANARHFS